MEIKINFGEVADLLSGRGDVIHDHLQHPDVCTDAPED